MGEGYAPPSIDPADEDSLAGVLRSVMGKFLQGVDDCLPAIVIAGNRNTVTVQPQIMMGSTDGQKVSRAQVAEVPVLQMGAGGFVLSFPVKPGDFGWIKASDRDISLFRQGLAEEWPNTKRMHSFQDGVFIPDVMRQWTLNGEDAESVVLQSTDGATRIAVAAGTVKITAPDGVTIDAPAAHFTGDVQVDGTLTADVDVIAAGKSGAHHTHGGVQAGGASTGGPQ